MMMKINIISYFVMLCVINCKLEKNITKKISPKLATKKKLADDFKLILL